MLERIEARGRFRPRALKLAQEALLARPSATGYDAVVEPLKLIETDAGSFSLLLNDSATSDRINEAVEAAGHTPNGYFWEGVARTLIRLRAPELQDALHFDCEAGMFCAYGNDRSALEKLGYLLVLVATDPTALQDLMNQIDPDDFDD